MAANRTVGNGKSETGNNILGGDPKPFKSKPSAQGDGRIMTVIDTRDISIHSKNMAAGRTVVLVGKTGNGKSATGNSILGDPKPFKSKLSGKGVTESTGQARAIDGRFMTVIDTPGLFDFSRGDQFLKNEIRKCFEIAKDGVHALLVVLSLSKGFSEEETNAVGHLIQFFGEKIKIKDYMIIVFTGGDQLEADDESIKNIIRDPSKQLKEIMDMCDNKYVVFNNTTNEEGKKADQRNQLISLVDKVSSKQPPITKDMFLQVLKNAGSSTKVLGLINVPAMMRCLVERLGTSNPMMRNLILVGRTGNGKSATGNSILRDDKFKSKVSAVGVTTTCAKGTITLEDGRIINVIDTPGFYDFSGDPGPIQEEIINCTMGLKGDDGIHAVLVVLSLKNRFTKEENDAISFLKKACFSDKIISDYMIVVLTGGDELEANDESITIEDLLGDDSSEPLKEILEMCDNRYVVMDNKTKEKVKKDEQLEKLYGLVEKVFEDNGRKPYMEDITQMNLGELNQFRRNASMEKEPHEDMQQNSTKYPNRREGEDPSGTGEKKSRATYNNKNSFWNPLKR